MNLSCTYLGHTLPHPFIVGASPMVDDLAVVRRLEDSGAAAIVMRSLFEEQVLNDELASALAIDGPALSFAEAESYLPEPAVREADDYLQLLATVRDAVDVPLFGSLNGIHGGRWLKYAEQMVAAGANGIELNLYQLPTDSRQSGADIEEVQLEMVAELKRRIAKPVAVKLSPAYTALPHFARRLQESGADALVLFNRFYQADIDPEALDVVRRLELSDSSELLLRLRWLAVLSPQLQLPLAVTGGVHTPIDAVKSVMAGASAIQLVSTLLRHGPERIGRLRDELARWLTEHGYSSLQEMRGCMDLSRCPDPTAFERANYMELLRSWQ